MSTHTSLEERTGCLSCGADLVYRAEASPMVCDSCGARRDSHARCVNGHFFCDACHSASAFDAIEQVCLESAERNPVAITRAAMRHPAVKMHGPEHHFLAPAALVSAWCNARNEPRERKVELIAEAKRRARQVPGGTCGYWGACGAGIGTGIFVSVVTGATPRSREPWALAQAVTAESLGLFAKLGGPRCCKRNTWLAMLTAAKFSRAHLGVDLPARGGRCEFTALNADCHQRACPFSPAGAVAGASLEAAT